MIAEDAQSEDPDMASEGWFRKRSKFTQAHASANAAKVPEGVAIKCLGCGQILFTSELEKNLKVCPSCGHHHRMAADERIAATVDEGSFVALYEDLVSVDPLRFPDYPAKLEKGVAATGKNDGTVIGTAAISRIPVVLGVTDFRFVGGSMGCVAGELFVRAMEEGKTRNLPVVVFTASGGARMYEGLLSLMQMAKTAAAVARFVDTGLPYIVVLTDPTTAGVLASYASLGDIILAEPGATIGFAGARVAAQATVQKPPEGYQTAEWQLERGQIDQIVLRRDMPGTLASLLTVLGFGPRPEAMELAPTLRNGTGGAATPFLSGVAVG
jgi:acetyl-CoA carboxylase carboxyl transferase subunit beta